jgi:hypothetical protein
VHDDDPTRPVDLLASSYRAAIAQRSPDPLLALMDSRGAVVEVDVLRLPIVARLGDGGPRPNPLWSRWVGFGRELRVRELPEFSKMKSETKRKS